jgi:hypothetical protein
VGAFDYEVTSGYLGSFNNSYIAQNNGVGENCRWGTLECLHGNISIEWIADGTSTTILFGELAGRPDLWQRNGSVAFPKPFGKGVVPCCLAKSGASPSKRSWNNGGCWACLENGQNWMSGSTFDGHNSSPVGSVVCVINCVNEAQINLFSFHPGSCGIAMDDGSARMISENISLVTFARLISAVGHTPVPDQF